MSRTMSSSASFSLKIFTALSGSPTYCGAANRTVFTSPPLCTSKQGVILGLSISQLREVPQQTRPEVMALLGMELDAVNVAVAHRRAEVGAVRGYRAHIFRVGALEEEGVQEVEAGIRV